MLIAELIERERAREHPEDVFAMLDDRELCALVAAWPKICSPVDELSEAETYKQAWGTVFQELLASEVQIDVIANMMGTAANVATAKLVQASMLRLIHLDGTVHQFAQVAVRAKVRMALGLKGQKGASS